MRLIIEYYLRILDIQETEKTGIGIAFNFSYINFSISVFSINY